MKTRMRNMGLGAMALLAVCGMNCPAIAADNPNVVVHDAWVRMPASSRTDTAAYMVIENKSATARSVVSASSKDVTKVELHEMKMASPGKTDAMNGMSGMSHDTTKGKEAGGQMMTMMPVAKIAIPAKGRASLEPNGYHVMLFGLKSKLTEDSKVSITLTLDDGSTVPVTASVRRSQ
jgi:periplasmic copper chaperone A